MQRNLYWRQIGDNFQVFCTSLRVPQKIVDSVASARSKIITQLNTDFYNIESDKENSSYLGSYARGTAIGVEDVDMLYVLPPQLFEKFDINKSVNNPMLLREAVRDSIRKIYPTCYLGADGKVIRIDLEYRISFEIFPAFLNDDNSYTFADSTGNGVWSIANPKPEIQAIVNTNNQLRNKNLSKLCRMIKAWKEVWQVPMGGLLVDTLAYDFLTNWKRKECNYSFYDWMVRDFFEYLMKQDPTQEYWSAPGSGERVYRRGPFEQQANICFELADQATEIHSEDFPKAVKNWSIVFGEQFPMDT